MIRALRDFTIGELMLLLICLAGSLWIGERALGVLCK